jgi:hypothetical protein
LFHEVKTGHKDAISGIVDDGENFYTGSWYDNNPNQSFDTLGMGPLLFGEKSQRSLDQ